MRPAPAATRRANRLPPPQRKTSRGALLSVLAQPMVLLLLACTCSTRCSAARATRHPGRVDRRVAAISVYQELRTQRVLEALRDLASPRSTVVRGRRVSRDREPGAGRWRSPDRPGRRPPGLRRAPDRGARAARRRVAPDRRIHAGRQGPARTSESAGMLRAGTLVVQGDGVAERHRHRRADTRSAASAACSHRSSRARAACTSS